MNHRLEFAELYAGPEDEKSNENSDDQMPRVPSAVSPSVAIVIVIVVSLCVVVVHFK